MNARQKARDLIELALEENGDDKERIAAAMKALRIIRKYDLLSSPLDGLLSSDNETVKAATSIFEKLTDPDLVNSVKKISGRISQARRRR
jgi:hypothetical protein